jgi:hypothetical protein
MEIMEKLSEALVITGISNNPLLLCLLLAMALMVKVLGRQGAARRKEIKFSGTIKWK